MKRKKVLHIVEAFGGGIFSVLLDLTNKMVDEFDISIAYAVRAETPRDFKNYFDKRIKFIKIENFTRNISPQQDIKALKEIKKAVKEEEPDIVHLHSSKAGVLGRLAISGRKVKMFYNPHGFSFLKQDNSKLKRMIYWLIEKATAIYNKKCTIVGCSNGEYLEAKKLNKNSICINNGIDIEKLKKETEKVEKIAHNSSVNDYTVEENKRHIDLKEIDCNNLKICTVGRIEYQKNPKVFNEIASSMPTIQFTWIGDGELKDTLVSSNIKVTGWKTRKEVLEILSKQDIFILTSLWEGLPISLLEAMYMKKICIVSNCIGNRDVIENGVNGFIAETSKDYIKIIENIQKNKANIQIKNNAHNDIMTKYNNNVMTQKYKKVYVNK